MANYSFADQEMLLIRLINVQNQGKKFSVLVGSGLTMPNLANSELGVSSVSEIIQDIRGHFLEKKAIAQFEKNVSSEGDDSNQYQAAMMTLLSTFGQDELNNVIRRAVLNSMKKKFVFKNSDEIKPETLEEDPQSWYLRRGVDALGEIFVDFNDIFSGPILTSNFDPLLEISIRKHGGNPQSIFLVNDGKFLNHHSQNTQSVVHLHGYWFGGDTLHTIDQLRRERPQLKGDLKKLLHTSVLIVIGYGGWNDVFTNSLIELIKEGNNDFEVLWCFHESDEKQIEEKYFYAIDKLSTAINQRVVLYKNVDCHDLFPKLLKELNLNRQEQDQSLDASAIHIQLFDTQSDEETEHIEGFTCDIPPNNLYWVGRKMEISLLSKADYKTCFITGFGGQGKSGLASHFIRNNVANDSQFEFWDWRDCKEEDNKFQTILISQIERVSRGKYKSSSLIDESNQELINLLFNLLHKRKIVFVFDNVDHYIDLVSFEPIGGIMQLVNEANSRNHSSLFIFTCRPQININSSNFLALPLKELTKEDTYTLLKSYAPPIADIDLHNLSQLSHKLTNGHALWLSLIAAQAKRGLDIVHQFLDAYKQNNADQINNPSSSLAKSILNVVWKSLNVKQQTLLRGLAEIVTAFDKDELENIFKPQLSLNQFNKAFNFLNSLNLLVVKSQTGKKNLYELHPLVKEFVIAKFQKNERAAFIMLIVNYYDQIIIWIKPKLNADSPLSYFEKYTQKAELHLNNGDFKNALLSLHEISKVIIAAGFSEEYIRVCSLLLSHIDWLKAVTQEFPYFHDQFRLFTQSQIERNNFLIVEENLSKYLSVIPGKSINYLSYCAIKAYYLWFKGDFAESIKIAEEGLEIQKNTGVGDFDSLSGNQGLAYRDSGTPENLVKALAIFLKGERLREVLTRNFASQSFSSVFFGNIGRCLWLQKEYDDAAICYFKSFMLLKREKNEKTIINMGYACLWIAETTLLKQDQISTIYFLKYCLQNWEKTAPIKAQKTRRDHSYILDEEKNNLIFIALSTLEVEKYCNKYVEINLEKSYTAKENIIKP